MKVRELPEGGDYKLALKLFKKAVKLRIFIPLVNSKLEQDLNDKEFDPVIGYL